MNNLTELIFIIYCIQFNLSRFFHFARFCVALVFDGNRNAKQYTKKSHSISNSFFFLNPQITCSGLFEFRLKSFRNDNGLNSFGRCCSQKALPSGSCQGSCKTRFRICLKQYQAEIDTTSSCTFGAAATKILGDNTFNLTATRNPPQEGTSINPISFPFDFTWPVSI